MTMPVAQHAHVGKKPTPVQTRILSRMIREGAKLCVEAWGIRLVTEGRVLWIVNPQTFTAIRNKGWIEQDGEFWRVSVGGRKAAE